MRTASLAPGDLVEADVRGCRFRARILNLRDDLIPGKPIHVYPLGHVNYPHLNARQIVRRLGPAHADQGQLL